MRILTQITTQLGGSWYSLYLRWYKVQILTLTERHTANMPQPPPTATQNFEADPEDDEEGERMYLLSEAQDVLGKLGKDWPAKVYTKSLVLL